MFTLVNESFGDEESGEISASLYLDVDVVAVETHFVGGDGQDCR